MTNVILRGIGAIGFSVALSSAINASALESAFMGGFLYLLFATTDNS